MAGSATGAGFRLVPRPAADLVQARLVLDSSNNSTATPDAMRNHARA